MAHQYYEGSNKPINAYSMDDMERLTRGGNFEFKRGKDKKKRKSRAGVYAGIGAAGLAGAAGIGAGVRYGRSELAMRNARKNINAVSTTARERQGEMLSAQNKATSGYRATPEQRKMLENDFLDKQDAYNDAARARDKVRKDLISGGAQGRFDRDREAVKAGAKRFGQGVSNISLGKGGRTVGTTLAAIGYGAKNIQRAAQGGYRKDSRIIEDGKMIGRNYLKGATGATKAVWSAGRGGKAALIGAGLLGAGTVAGGGYAAYKALKNRKNRD